MLRPVQHSTSQQMCVGLLPHDSKHLNDVVLSIQYGEVKHNV